MTLNIDGFNRMPKNQSAKMYQLAISIKNRIQRIMLSAAIHTSIYVYAHETGFDYGLIIPGFWVRIPEGPPPSTSGFPDIQSIRGTALLLVIPSRIHWFLLAIHHYPPLICE